MGVTVFLDTLVEKPLNAVSGRWDISTEQETRMSGTAEPSAFLIVLSDGISDLYSYSIPDRQDALNRVYLTYGDARRGLEIYTKTLEGFLPVAYGEAFPYENVSFEKLLIEKGYATYGWRLVLDDETGETLRLSVGLLKIPICAPGHSG